jgi:hypothetical protein
VEHFSRQLKGAVLHSGFYAGGFLMSAPALKSAGFLFIPLSAVRLKVKMNS